MRFEDYSGGGDTSRGVGGALPEIVRVERRPTSGAMKLSTLAARNLLFYKRTNAAVILGGATAIAVLSGALLVGDSVRASLRDLVLQRLGKTEGVVTSAQFFREALANDVAGSAPLIALQGIVTHVKDGRPASNGSGV